MSVSISRPRDHGATLVVTALASAFGVVLLEATSVLTTVIENDAVGSSGNVRLGLTAVTGVFALIAVYVGAIVTANTFATVIAGRTRQIALLRLLGAQSRTLRRRVVREGLMIGFIGAVIGLVVGFGVTVGAVALGMAQGWLPELAYSLVDVVLIVPVVIVALTTGASAGVGSRRVATVSPVAATAAAVEESATELASYRGRTVTSVILGVLGGAFLVLGVVAGFVSPLGLFIAFVGGVLSFTGVILGAHVIMPSVLRLVGRLVAPGAAGRLAAANVVRHPERSARATIGLVIGVTLVTLFAVAMTSYNDMVTSSFEDDPEVMAVVQNSITVSTAIFMSLVGFSAVIAAVGVVNNLSLSVLQRTRELGLLRAIGFSARQVRQTITVESAQMTIAAVGFGLVLGIIYGWAAAQSLLGALTRQIVVPTVPWPVLVGVVVSTAALTVIASIPPSRRATRVSPVVALAIE
ncbi:FtsX-like permease family protein [Agromyces atrinae]|uniref:ABC transporter permease n=1 Tax=Agromyces atrinae TaxID=592376 RepID=UPI001F59CCB9|nr:FtsX-like permease family protein [Agromyces atrinae]MCI2958770.1 FtsX-like permease family protein [Agromyces atrinae]